MLHKVHVPTQKKLTINTIFFDNVNQNNEAFRLWIMTKHNSC